MLRSRGGALLGARSSCSHACARCRIWRERFCAHSKPIPIRDQRELQVGWARLALAPPSTSLDFSRSNARGRSDLHSPKDVRTSQTHVGPGILPVRRGKNAASTPLRPNGVVCLCGGYSRLRSRQHSDGIAQARDRGKTHYRGDFPTLQPLQNARE